MDLLEDPAIFRLRLAGCHRLRRGLPKRFAAACTDICRMGADGETAPAGGFRQSGAAAGRQDPTAFRARVCASTGSQGSGHFACSQGRNAETGSRGAEVRGVSAASTVRAARWARARSYTAPLIRPTSRLRLHPRLRLHLHPRLRRGLLREPGRTVRNTRRALPPLRFRLLPRNSCLPSRGSPAARSIRKMFCKRREASPLWGVAAKQVAGGLALELPEDALAEATKLETLRNAFHHFEVLEVRKEEARTVAVAKPLFVQAAALRIEIAGGEPKTSAAAISPSMSSKSASLARAGRPRMCAACSSGGRKRPTRQSCPAAWTRTRC